MKIKMNILLVILTLFSFNVNAQKIKKITKGFTSPSFEGCRKVLASKSGVVYSLAPGRLKTKVKSGKATVKISKTGGRAKTIVNIYVNNKLKKRITFENGNYKKTEKRVLSLDTNNWFNKVEIEIVNQSVGNTFKYTAEIIAKDRSMIPGKDELTGRLWGLAEKTFTIKKPCTGRVKIAIHVTSGRGQALVQIYSYNGNLLATRVLSHAPAPRNTPDPNEFMIDTNGDMNIHIKNIAATDNVWYKIEAQAEQKPF